MGRHLIWDWNGTLLDDTTLVVQATNDAFASCGGPRVDIEHHRRGFRRPVAEYYAEVLGRPLDEAEFAVIDKVFHASYRALLAAGCSLTPGAVDALEEWQRAGRTQSLLSMAFHDELVDLVKRYQISEYFSRIDGLRAAVGGGTKVGHLIEHLRHIGLEGPDCVVVGDSLDDAVAAEAVGARCVLVDTGVTHTERLRATGLPVASGPAEAVAFILGETGLPPVQTVA